MAGKRLWILRLVLATQLVVLLFSSILSPMDHVWLRRRSMERVIDESRALGTEGLLTIDAGAQRNEVEGRLTDAAIGPSVMLSKRRFQTNLLLFAATVTALLLSFWTSRSLQRPTPP